MTENDSFSDSLPAARLFRTLLRTLSHLRQITEPYFARHGISGPQWGVLRTLHRAHNEGMESIRLSDLGNRLLIRPPSVTGVVDRLERVGLVKRRPSNTDLRARELSLTDAGRQLVERMLKGHSTFVQSLFGGLSNDELNCLLNMLEQLDAHLGTLAASQEHGLTDGPSES